MAYFAKNREKVLKQNREWYARNKVAVLKTKREYFQNNYSRLQPQRRKWILENRTKVRQYIRIADWRRRVWAQINGGECTLEKAMLRVEYFEWKCRYCHKELTIRTLTLDHQIPLARKGTNWPSNLVPCCKRCNSRKNKKTRTEFLLHLERYGI